MCDAPTDVFDVFLSSTIAPTDANERLTSKSKTFMLHLLPSRSISSVASPSTVIVLLVAAARFKDFSFEEATHLWVLLSPQ